MAKSLTIINSKVMNAMVINAIVGCLLLVTCLTTASAQQTPPELADKETEGSKLPEIVNCCPLSTITLSQATADVSLKDELLPVPRNEAAIYLENHGVQIARPVVGAPSLRHPQAVCYQPLYFEDPNLERCGAGHGLATELASAVRFFGRAPLIPYMVGSQDPHRCVMSLGDCEVCQRYGKGAYLPPLNAKGVAFEAAAIVGLVFLLP